MSTNVDTSQSPILTTSACFDIQELRSRSQASDDSFEEFLPAIEVMPICAQLSKKKKKNAFGNTENRRARYALVPAVFGVDGSSPPRVTSWRFKVVNCSNSKENSFKRKRTNATEMKRTDESSCDAYVRSHRWGYSSPAFYCRSPPAQLYKLKNSMRLESNPADHCDVPGMTVQQAILFRRTLGTKFLGNNQECLQESRKHNNTPVYLEAATQKPLKEYVSPDLKTIQACQGDKESKESGHGNRLRPTYQTVMKRVKSQREKGEDNKTAMKCSPSCVSETQVMCFRNSVIQKKIEINLSCLDTSQES